MLWRQANCPIKWKLQVYQAVIVTKLLYGLETVHLTEANKNKINAFQIRGLRQILKKKHTFYNRNHTNAHILQEATKLAYPKEEDLRKVKKFGDVYEDRRVKLLGHIIRTENHDPLRQVSLKPGTAERPDIGKKRIGGPKQNWTRKTKEHVWNSKLKRNNYEENALQDSELFNLAKDRAF